MQNDLDPNALNRALVIYEKSFPDAATITYDGVIAAIKIYLAALPPASGVPEAEAVAQYRVIRGTTEKGPWFDGVPHSSFGDEYVAVRTLYAALPPVAAPTDAQRVWADAVAYGVGVMRDGTHISATKVFAAPPVESQEMTREEQADALHGPLWRTAPDNRTAYEIVDCLRRDGFRIVRGAPKSGEK